MPEILAEAQRLVSAGLSIIPIKRDGSKAPDAQLLPLDPDDPTHSTWKPYQERRATEKELIYWFRKHKAGVGIVAGAISGNLEILDFDDTDLFPLWSDLVEELAPGLVQRLPLVETPRGGRHLYSRCATIQGNQKLAQRPGANDRPKTTIETRGEGGYVLAPGCPLACHALRKPYVLIDGDLAEIPTIAPGERAMLLNGARTFNTYVAPERLIAAPPSGQRVQAIGDRPGDRFNASVTWEAILAPHGWTIVGHRGELTLWKRPGKRERGWSATTNYGGSDLLYVFSSNASPFEPERGYSKFGAHAILEYEGDFQAAAKSLAAQGYSERHAPPGREPLLAPGSTNGSNPWVQRWQHRQRAYEARLRLPAREVSHE
ncbi:MAG: bifunctional DNA primase/polymerase [Candidatus Entotheonellia bacterium]